MWFLIAFIILLVIFIAWALLSINEEKIVSPAIHLSITLKERIGIMEKYTLSWTPSPDTFVEEQRIYAGVSGAPPVMIGQSLGSSTSSTEVDFPTGSAVILFIKTIGDNGSQADSEQLSFIADNQQKVRAATNLNLQWKEHID